MAHPPHPKLPVITLTTETLTPTTPVYLSTSHAVRRALEEYGSFVISTDIIPVDLRQTMFELSKQLFLLPMEVKIKNSSKILGFGYGNYPTLPLFEAFGVEDGNTMDATRRFTQLLFPCGNDAFCKTTFEYMKLLSEIHDCVMRMVFDSYGIEDERFNKSIYLARFLKYRAPIHEGEGPFALPPHTDKSFLGVLDDNGVKGLEIKMRNGKWISHESTPSTFVVIAGEPLMAWSNGRIYAPLHQVAMRTSTKEVVRYSTGIFSFMREMVEVPNKLVDDEYYLRFKPFNNMDFLKYVNTKEGSASEYLIESYCGIMTYTSDDA